MPGIQLVCQRAEQGGLRGGLVYHNNLQVFNHKDTKTRPIMDGFRKNNVNYWVFREIRSIIPHL